MTMEDDLRQAMANLTDEDRQAIARLVRGANYSFLLSSEMRCEIRFIGSEIITQKHINKLVTYLKTMKSVINIEG